MVGESKETLMGMESVRKYLNSHGIFMSNPNIWYWGRKGMANKVEKRVNRCFLFCKREDVDRLIYARKKLFNASQLALEVGCNHNQIRRWVRRGMPKVDVFGSTFFDIEAVRQWLEANHVVYGKAWRARLKKEQINITK